MIKFWDVLGFLSLLISIAFIFLKKFEIISWSWVLVFLPIILYFGVVISILGVIFIISLFEE